MQISEYGLRRKPSSLKNYTYEASVGASASTIDLPDDHWAYNAIKNVVNSGLMQGRSEDEFAPDDKMTRAEFATVVNRLMTVLDKKIEDGLKC